MNAFLTYCKMKGYRKPERDNYGWARLVQVIGNFFGGNLTVGIDTLDRLDCDNGDNGVYIIENWEIVDRKYFDGCEQRGYGLTEFLVAIDENQPERERFGADYIKGTVVKPFEMKIGDVVGYMEWDTEIVKAKIVGIGEDKTLNGRNVKGVPYVAVFTEDDPSNNPNNYLWEDREYRKLN